ncbi:hypothetical protein J5Y03_08020 [Bacillus sp. RG28]|uniref:Uncharacterized protein n=1 Tax=Gottfriedia endophytica TaxID=2820819 RepID=A0A940NPF1_9BACI|nr:hypothetical protein [Gottfriedia endophytica]MBP0725138.1 hypothetical protein [Gottfriedia endophytica]
MKRNNFGKRSLIFGLAVVIIAVFTFIYSKVSTSKTVTPPATIQLNTQNQEPSSTDLFTIKDNEKNGTLYVIKRQLKNAGNVDISYLSMELMLLEKKQNRMGAFLIVNRLSFGGENISTKQLIQQGFDLSGDKQISLFELSLKPLHLGNLPVNKTKTLFIECEYLKGLPPFNSHNKKATVVVDIKYKY